MPQSNVLREKAQKLVHDMRDLNDKALNEKRDLNEEESASYNAMDADYDSLTSQIKRLDKAESAEKELKASQWPKVSEGDKGPSGEAEVAAKTKAYSKAFWAYNSVKRGVSVRPEIYNALQVGTDSEGGFLVPEEFETMLVKKLEQFNEIRSMAKVIRTESDRNIPVESSLGVSTWTGEEAPATESDPEFARKVLGAYKLTRIVKVSEELLGDSFFDMAAYVADESGRSHGVAEEAAFINGDSIGKPTGMLVDGTVGLTTASNSAITSDEVIDLFHALKRPYRKNATWVFSDDMVKAIRKLKDANNQYLWQDGLKEGEPASILGRPVLISDAVPTFAPDTIVGGFGDLSHYWIADRGNRILQRLNELYAETGQIGFKLHSRTDGKLMLAEAFQTVATPA